MLCQRGGKWLKTTSRFLCDFHGSSIGWAWIQWLEKSYSKELKQQRLQRQGKLHSKINLCANACILRLFLLGWILYCWQSTLSSDWMERRWIKKAQIWKFSRCYLGDYVKELFCSACCKCSTITLPHSIISILFPIQPIKSRCPLPPSFLKLSDGWMRKSCCTCGTRFSAFL